MKKCFLLVLFIISINNNLLSNVFVTSRPLGNGRMGNDLIAYIHAQWIAYENNLKFYYQPFDKSDYLMCSVMDEHLPNINNNRSWQKTVLRDVRKVPICSEKMNRKKHRLLEFVFLTYFSDTFVQQVKTNPGFLKHIRKRIAPRTPLKLIHPPKDVLSLAVHIRKGGGWDASLGSVQVFNLQYNRDRYLRPKEIVYVDTIFPLTHPPEQYYIDQIIEFSRLHDHQPIYVFIFTDEPLIENLVKRIKEQVNLSNIIFDYRKDGTGFHKYALDDFFSFQNFKNVVFTGKSTFTSIINLICDFDLKIYPTTYHWEYDELGRGYLFMDNIVYERN